MSHDSSDTEFRRLIEEYDQYDVGVALFDGRLKQLDNNANMDGGASSDLVKPGIEVLNQAWMYHDEVATVSGRVYLYEDSSLSDQLLARWGKPDVDEQGNRSYFVEDVELRSYGIIDGSHGDDLGGSKVKARIGYGFVLPDANSHFPQIVLYPDEASRHQYAIPTPEAIDVKLHRFWTDEMNLIDGLILPGDRGSEKLLRRLAAVAHRLEKSFQASADLREWTSIYINNRLGLDQVWPHMTQVKDELLCKDGDDWLNITCESPVVLYGRKPRIEFVREEDDHGRIHAMLFIELPDTEDEWEGSQVGIKAENVLRLRSTRMQQALVDCAFGAAEQNLKNMIVEHTVWEEPRQDNVSLQTPERPNKSGDPLFVEEMKLLDAELKAVTEVIKPFTRRYFETPEQAIEVSTRLVRALADRLIEARIADYMLQVEGEYALRPHTLRQPDVEVQPGLFVVQVDANAPFAKLQHGDSFRGTFYALHGDIESYIDEASGEERYYPYPYMVIDVGSHSTVMLNQKGVVPLLEVEVRSRGLIPLDGSVMITIPSLERYMADKSARMAAAAAYGRDPVVGQINKLFAALHHDTTNSYQELKHVERVRSIARRIAQNDLPGNTQPALEALESLLVKREVMAAGDIVTEEGELREKAFVDGIVVDLQQEISSSELAGPYLVILDKTGQYHYLRATTVRALAF